MGGLVLNPEHTQEPTVKLSDRVFDEEMKDMVAVDDQPAANEPEEKEKEKEDPKRTKIMGFNLDMKYPRTLRGFIRVLQILLLFVAMICTLLQSPWPDTGAFTFFVIVMVFCAFVSGFLLFSMMAGNQERGGFCGIDWKKLELIYFVVGFVLVFICACVAASKANGLAALSAAAAFGFIAAISFIICLVWAWKRYKSDDDDENKDEENKDDDKKSNLPQDEGAEKMQEFRINMLDETKSRMDAEERKQALSRHNSLHRANSFDPRKYNSNPDEMRNNGRFNPSDKDSAYSEGGDFERDQARRSLPNQGRRTGSFHQRGSMKRIQSQQRYPQELDPRSLSNHRNHHSNKQRNGVPNWLHAAMESDEETVAPTQSINPHPQRGEFPLLPTSDEESVAYPSVSQTLGANGRPVNFQNPNVRNPHQKHRHHRTMPHGGSHKRKGMGGHLHMPHKMHRGHHRGHRTRGHRHSRRRKGHHDNGIQNGGTRTGNFPELKPIETGSRRVIPEQPASIHFPEQSRWDEPELDRGMAADKYFGNHR